MPKKIGGHFFWRSGQDPGVVRIPSPAQPFTQLPVAGVVKDAEVMPELAVAAHPVASSGCTGPITAAVLGTTVDGPIRVVMAQIPSHPRQDRPTTSPAHRGTGSDQHSHSLTQSLMPTSVAECCSALLHRHNVIARQTLGRNESDAMWEKCCECKRVLTPQSSGWNTSKKPTAVNFQNVGSHAVWANCCRARAASR